jgi:hypothetical protein
MNNIESKPTVNQLKKLAAIGASSTIENASRRRSERTGEFYAIDKLDSISMRNEGDGLESIRHSMGMRMGKRVVDDAFSVWKLEYFDTYRIDRYSDECVKATTKYRFEWNARSVLLARRASSLITIQDSLRSSDLGDEILRFHIRDDEAAILEAQMEFEQVTREDCDRLIDSTAAYYAQVRDVNRQFVL